MSGRTMPAAASLALIAALARAAWPAQAGPERAAAPAATLVVTSDGDEADRSPGDGQCASTAGACTLRAALQEAEAREGADVVQFRIGTGIRTIRPATPLPIMAGPITLDGSTQPGYAGAPLVEIDGSALEVGDAREGPGLDGLVFVNGGHTVRALSIGGFEGAGIVLAEGDGNRVLGCYIGVDATGLAARPNGDDGLVVTRSADNAIGGEAAAERNLVSGNGGRGIFLDGPRATGNRLTGNVIGLAADGTALPNGAQGILVQDAPDNAIGGRSGSDGNIVAGNAGDGIVVRGVAASGNLVAGNLVGARGADDPANGGTGILIDGAPETTIGGDLAARNWIAGNRGDGIALVGPDARDGRVGGNLVGLGTDGATARGNGGDGIRIVGAPDNRVGGPGGLVPATWAVAARALTEPVTSTVLAGNVVAFSGGDGIEVGGAGARGNAISGNAIGVTASGAPAGNADHGILLDGAPSNEIGGPDGGGNAIAANGGSGVAVVGIGARRNRLVGNDIGVVPPSWPSATLTTGNRGEGVLILGAPDTLVGDGALGGSGRGNAIGRNEGDGVRIAGDGADRGAVRGNRIGVAADGSPAPNGGDAVAVIGGARRTVVAGNRIGHAARHGISVAGAGTDHTAIAANAIHDSGGDGIRVWAGAGGAAIGAAEPGDAAMGNEVRGSAGAGIALLGDESVVAGNRLGPARSGDGDAAGYDARAPGIRVAGAHNRIGPGNEIAGQAGDGLLVEGDPAEATVVVGNAIGRTPAAEGNRGAGIRVRARARATRIGDDPSGTVPGADGNRIEGNLGPGIALEDAHATVLGNAIDGNGGVGIDAGPGAAPPPAWEGAMVPAARAAMRVEASLGAAIVEVFAAEGCDPSGAGEGAVLLARRAVAAGADEPSSRAGSGSRLGSARLVLDLAGAATAAGLDPVGLAVSATATGPDGRTSAFSSCRHLVAPGAFVPLAHR